LTLFSFGQDSAPVTETPPRKPESESARPGNAGFRLPGLETLVPSRPHPTVRIKKFPFRGNTEFSDAQLDEAIVRAIGAYPNRGLRPEDLEKARMAVNLLYIEAGFVNSSAVLGDHGVKDGTGRVLPMRDKPLQTHGQVASSFLRQLTPA